MCVWAGASRPTFFDTGAQIRSNVCVFAKFLARSGSTIASSKCIYYASVCICCDSFSCSTSMQSADAIHELGLLLIHASW